MGESVMSRYILLLILILVSFIPSGVFANNNVISTVSVPMVMVGDSGGYYSSNIFNTQSSVVDNGNRTTYAIGQEIVERRTENGKTIYMGKNGKNDVFKTVIAIGAIHYKDNYSDSNEQWKDIDTTIRSGRLNTAPYELTINLNTVTIRDKRSGSVATVTLGSIGGKSVQLPTFLTEDGNKATAVNIATDTDLEIVAGGSGVKFTRILKSNKAPADATFMVNKYGEGITIAAKAEDNKDTPDKDIKVTSSLVNGVLTETIDKNKDGLVYPIKIDPTISVQIASTNDDYLLYYNGANWVGSTAGVHIGMYSASVKLQGNGLRFQSVDIPQTATISSAYLNLTCKGATASTTVSARIVGEDVDDAATFSTAAGYQARRGTVVDGANNNYITTAVVDWDNIAAWSANENGADTLSPDIKTIVQEIISRTGWATGNDLVIFIGDHEGRGDQSSGDYRWAYDYTDSTTLCAKLEVVYTAPATISTIAPSSVEETYATTGGSITEMGEGNVTSYGIQYGTTGSYGLWANVTETRTAIFNFYQTLGTNTTALSKGELYYYRAWANDSLRGYSYGSQDAFITKPDEPTAFTTTTLNSTAITCAWTTGTGYTNTIVRYDDGAYPATVTSGHAGYNGTLNTYIQSGLSDATVYYFRAWSWASKGASEFQYSDLYAGNTTTTSGIPLVTTNAATSVEETTATANAAITYSPATLTKWGVQYGASTGYGNWDNTSSNPGVPYSIAKNLTVLSKGTLYYFRGFAVNAIGEGYGSQVTFLTKPDEPTALWMGGGNSTTIDFTWTRGAGALNTVVTYKDGSYPATVADGTIGYNGTGSSFSAYGLSTSHTYYARAWSWASNTTSNVYSDTYSQTYMLRTADLPSVDVADASLVTSSSARLNGNIINDGNEDVAIRWGYGTISQTVFANYGGANGTISAWSVSNYTTGNLPFYDATMLTGNVTYYFNIQAQNSGGYAIGVERNFFTTSFNVTTCPNYFTGVPASTTIDLQWAKTGSLAYVKLYYQPAVIPTDNTTGVLIYSGSANYFRHTPLTPGTSYGYRIYAYESGMWSANSSTVLLTTLPASTTTSGLTTPSSPSSMYLTPDSSYLSENPFHELIEANATSIGMPVGNFFLLLNIVLGLIIGLIVYSKSKDELIALIGIVVIFGFGTSANIMPIWVTIGTGLLIIPLWALRRRA